MTGNDGLSFDFRLRREHMATEFAKADVIKHGLEYRDARALALFAIRLADEIMKQLEPKP